MTFALSKLSLSRLEGVNPKLVAVVKRAITLSTVDFMVVEGVRSAARQKQLYAQGRTVPGKVVTWTLKSKHIDGLAVDLLPAPYDWKDPKGFDAVNRAMMRAAGELGVGLRWGGNWDGDDKPREKGETDSPHWELA
ncbi:M15 family metallopeptidase [Phenylobacterium sp.]|uniref:M15 family metallopeptidase n=1 Tax=Phenylobacterium sp. TaxID=1871053 RepID=UPI0027378072|nr:M15 family metallopeptidase [Phenylobacterium sp.]MDP3869208.1 M15 family metallopeptidase [Phenylobacterium sp.]